MRKLQVFPAPTPATSKEDWTKLVREMISRYQRMMRSNPEKGDGTKTFDLTEPMAKRRQKAIVNTMGEIYTRYKAPEGGQRILAEAWRDLNLPFETYAHMDREWHLLYAASIWILDQLTKQEGWREVFRFLPRDETSVDYLVNHDACHPNYEEDLIYSVEYVLHNRNPIEIDGAGYHRSFTTEALAKGKKSEGDDRSNFESLLAMIPQAAIDAAVDRFKELFWQWVDRFFEGAALFMQTEADYYNKIRNDQIKFNKMADELDALMRKMKKKPVQLPLARPSFEELMKKPPSLFGADKEADDGIALSMRMDRLEGRIEANIDAGNELQNKFRTYQMRMTRAGHVTSDDLMDFGEIQLAAMQPMKIGNPYELCFALLYLVEIDDDLPWLYGASCGLMAEVADALPWGIYEYDEIEDDIWMGDVPLIEEVELPKSVNIPDWFDRVYQMKGDESPRSLAQIVYEETGCVPPSNLHIYDDRAKMLGKYGIRGKDAAMVLMMMSTLATTRRSKIALNLDEDIDLLLGAEREEEAQKGIPAQPEKEDPQTLKEEIKRLKAALHASDKENRETKKKLASLQATTDLEHRELADLREYVFNGAEAIEEEEVIDETQWPYEVQRDTLVFGGHATWAKGIKGLLTGNVRFIDKELISFDTGIIKRTDVIWIQPNAMSHTMYYRIVDTARVYNKPVRYFSFASWAKCAEQVVEGDRA